MSEALVAIVGAPNVGKSTLFNRLIGRRRSIVTDQPGVTRDRIYGEVRDAPRPFRLVDTGGLTDEAAPFAREIEQQAEAALDEAALILFVVDARAGLTALDRDVAAMLRRRGTPLLLLANKIDSAKQARAVGELFELGLGEAFPISAEHGRGIEELVERIDELLDPPVAAGQETGAGEQALRVAIVGRPNVGKSSLLNRLAGEERAMVSDLPGTTRDAVDSLLELGDRRYLLIDTAGMRRVGRVRERVERYSVSRARDNIARCDVVVLVIDATEELAAQDTHIAGYVQDAMKPLVVAVNKWDLVSDRERKAKEWTDEIRYRLRFAKEAPILLISALSGQRVRNVLEQADRLYAAGGIRIATPEVNRWLQQVARAELATPGRSRALRLYYATQTGVHPPRFALFCNDPSRVHFSFRRYLENTLRERFGFGGSPIHLSFRRRREP